MYAKKKLYIDILYTKVSQKISIQKYLKIIRANKTNSSVEISFKIGKNLILTVIYQIIYYLYKYGLI